MIQMVSLLATLIFFSLITVVNVVASGYEATEEDFVRWENAWDSLIPPGAYDFVPKDFYFELLFNPTFQSQLDEAGRVINPLLDGQSIEIAGFMVPIEVQGEKVSQFLLVPEAGQCIHIPPPPLNQTLLVDTTTTPTPLRDLYQPIIVSGRLSVGTQSFEIADSGYSLVAAEITTLNLGEDMIPVVPGADGDR